MVEGEGVRKGGRVMIIAITRASYGGAPKSMTELANHWARQGRDVHVTTWADEPGGVYPLDGRVHEHCLRLAGRSSSRIDALQRNLRAILRVRGLVRATSSDVLIAFGHRAAVVAVLAALLTRTHVVGAIRTDPGMHPRERFWRLASGLSYVSADRVVVQTHAAQVQLPAPARRLSKVVPNALWDVNESLETRPLYVSSHGRRRVVALGRLSPEKGVDMLLDAFAAVSRKHDDWDLVVYGDGPIRSAIERQRDRLGLGERVQLPGATDQPLRALAGADMFVLPSRREGFPNALVEAMSLDLPVISFDCPSGPAEIIRHEHDGLLVAAADVSGLTAAMSRLMGDPVRRQELGRAAGEVRDRFSPVRIGALWDEILDELLGGPSGAA